MKLHGKQAHQCYLCPNLASSRCSKCGQPICEAHEQMSASPQGGKLVRCPPCTRRDHQEALRLRE